MYKENKVGVIGCDASGRNSLQSIMARLAGAQLKKVLYDDQVENAGSINRYPQAEVVQTKESIFHDENINLVIVAASRKNEFNLVSEALKAGKQVRIF